MGEGGRLGEGMKTALSQGLFLFIRASEGLGGISSRVQDGAPSLPDGMVRTSQPSAGVRASFDREGEDR